MAKKARKWSNLKGTLPEAPSGETSEWMQKVFAAKDARSDKTMAELAKEYQQLVEADEKAEEARKARNIIYEALERRILEELVKVEEVAGTDMWRGEGQTFSPKNVLRPTVTDRKALKDWIKEQGMEDLLELSHPRLQAIVNEAMDTSISATLTPKEREKLTPGQVGSGAPPPGVSVYIKTGVNRTGPRKKPLDPDFD